MSYEKEVERLLKLYEEVETEEEYDDEDDGWEKDVVETRSDDSDTEQEFDEAEHQMDIEFPHRVPFLTGKDGITKWRKHCTVRTVKTRQQNIIKTFPGVKVIAKNLKSPLDIWNFFFTDEMLEVIVESTNKKIQTLSQNYSRERDAKPTNIIEIKALIGLLYLAGVRHVNRLNSLDLWKVDGSGIEAFRLTMGINRFKFLLVHIRFDDIETREARRALDKLAPIRHLFDIFVQHCKDAYSHSEFVTIDEKLEGFRGKCNFRQYIPSKPNKYGLKVFAACDAKTFYTSAMEVYVGTQPEGPYRVGNSAQNVVERLCEHIFQSKRNITTDNWFTSIPLAESLKSKGLTLLGTIRKNKKELPQEMVTRNASRPIGSSMFAFQESTTLVSYVPKKNKNVLLLSTMHFTDDIDPSNQKPEMISLYNSTKGGVDVVDKFCAQYDCSRNTRRWPMVIFYCMMNVAVINSFIIYTANNPSKNTIRREFNRELSMALVYDYQKLRITWSAIPRTVKDRLREICHVTNEPIPERTEGQKGRCDFCDYKKNRKTRYFCFYCKKYLCLEHIVPICQDCKVANE